LGTKKAVGDGLDVGGILIRCERCCQ